ncbi:rhodanese-like domain-containing protein, partial [Azoarcus taiwanensis]|nr:rhodanese-like domain-containing protein [Azoarcus taiwanensis]
MDFLLDNWYWAALAVVTGTWLLVDMVRSAGDKTQLSPVEATLLINREDAVVVDVRDIGEYQQGHIPNARHIPLA